MSEIIDGRGRKFITKELDPGDLLDLLEAAGSNSGNSAWLRLAMVVCSVTAIDGVPLPLATTKQDVRTAAKQIGNDGLVALNKALLGDDTAGAAPSDVEAKDTAKN